MQQNEEKCGADLDSRRSEWRRLKYSVLSLPQFSILELEHMISKGKLAELSLFSFEKRLMRESGWCLLLPSGLIQRRWSQTLVGVHVKENRHNFEERRNKCSHNGALALKLCLKSLERIFVLADTQISPG